MGKFLERHNQWLFPKYTAQTRASILRQTGDKESSCL